MNSSNDSLAMQRITRLVDENSFIEIGSLVTARSTDFNLAATDTPSDGVITGHGLIDGNLVFIYSQDWLRYGSTSIAKNTRLRKISPAAQTGRIALPIVFSRSCFPDACWYPACAATGRGGVC